jgi:hypothetical protein
MVNCAGINRLLGISLKTAHGRADPGRAAIVQERNLHQAAESVVGMHCRDCAVAIAPGGLSRELA